MCNIPLKSFARAYYFLVDLKGAWNCTVLSETRYLPLVPERVFGAVRDDIGTISQTDFGYTFQRNLPDTGLMDYKARFYDPYLNRFIQPDTLVPNPVNPQSWNRFSYVGNNPINFSDPTGHMLINDSGGTVCSDPKYCSDGKPKPIKHKPTSDPSGGPRNGSIVVGFRFPEENVPSLTEMLEESYDDHSLNPGGDIYTQPNSFNQMSGGDMVVYGFGIFSVLSDYARMNAPRGVPPENVYAILNWEAQNDEFSVTDIDLINFTVSSVRITGVSLDPGHNTSPVGYRGSGFVGYNGNLPGTLSHSLEPRVEFSQTESIIVAITIKQLQSFEHTQMIRIYGSDLDPSTSLPDRGPWITTP